MEETEDGLYDAKLMADKMRRLGAVQRLHMILTVAKHVSHTASKVRRGRRKSMIYTLRHESFKLTFVWKLNEILHTKT